MLDAVIGALGVFGIGYGVYQHASGSSVLPAWPVVVGGVGQMGLFLASAGFGNARVDECRELLATRRVPHRRPGASRAVPPAPDAIDESAAPPVLDGGGLPAASSGSAPTSADAGADAG
jgi:hypothetical protein